MHCKFFEQHKCRSCELMGTPYAQQVTEKDDALKSLFENRLPEQWLSPVLSEESGCRNKAKMVVLGAAHQPVLGADVKRGEQIELVSLTHCPLYTEDMTVLLDYLQDWIRTSGIPPYNKVKKKGELKFILLTRADFSGEFMLRFVMRSKDAMARVEANLPRLQEAFPKVKVVSVNLQPVHMARLEGEEEVFLTEEQHLVERFNDVPLVVRPKSFFQTNPKVAATLYATAREWVKEIAPARMWDLFCGVGGFALHCASVTDAVTGIEIEPEAIASAKRSAEEMGIDNLSFDALDSTKFSEMQDTAPDLVLVNPPRRGLGKELVAQLEELAPQHIIYSSCNPDTLKADIDGLTSYDAKRLQWFDMFPHTDHAEVMVLLERRA
ncbi:23S rRNA (uracil(747)-C(5))-methyltransferase RlmC [Enterovibrio sp. ZSDZ35]|uniref:23S rRNA (uracil(747)-C(5))-methyltransferase RlmC n=1 Tax=Enterovibrio qingdaonensis TaxID=2899818 RepID=A0ABT5QJH7_9GAMM|nr:23S rRNA (uracil(747)-C(5))-methyltransferase RlmC [Enterovibrio sp. ZSDZ35]MDD1781134.1 23S rRNA (uracil(747)-C(5))-methyltransferase RlmC [Enterovibrio sp. ZSDZ35]